MKKHASLYWTSLISITTAVVCIGVPWHLAMADDAVASSAAATVTTPSAAPAATVSAQAPALPYGVAEVLKMYQAGISKDVLVGYIENTVLPFHLNADGIIYLKNLGLPQEVTTALIRRDGELQKQAMAYQQQQQSQPAPQQQAAAAANTAPPVTVPGTPAPVVSPYPDVAPTVVAPPVVYPDYSAYPYPYYGYPYYYGPNVIVGGGWGWGHGWGPGWGHGFGPGFGHGGFGGHR